MNRSGRRSRGTRELPESRIILYCYVVDDEGRLVGYVPVRRLLTSPLEAPVSSVMVDDVMAIPSWATVLVAAEYFVNHRLLAFPVVETSGKLVGVVDVTLFTDDVIALAKQSFDGIFQLLGIHATQALTPWSGLQGPFPLAAVQHRGRPALRGAVEPLRGTPERGRRPGAVHSGGAGAGREREHPVGDADAAEPAVGQDPLGPVRALAVPGGADRDHAGHRLRCRSSP